MQKANSEKSSISVVSFNPAINHQKEKLAVLLIKEFSEICSMPDDMSKVSHNEKWRERALVLAAELIAN